MTTDELYVTGVVIPNGLKDHEGDILNKTDIKKIFTKYTNRDTDTMHTRIRNSGVDVLANWISEKDMVIAGKTAPAGSWLATFKITNNEIIKSIKDGNITGLSLGSVSDTALTQKFWFINKSINYQDLDDMEEVIPLFISFVDKPSNMFGLEIMDYNVYINKRAKVDNMKEETTIQQEEKISLSGWEKIVKSFQALGLINKSVDAEELETEEVEIEKSVDTTEEPADISNTELLEKIPEAVATGITTAFEKMGEAKQQEEVKPVDEVAVEKSEEPAEEEEPEKEKADEVEDKPVKEEEVEINKRATSKEENVIVETTSNFYDKAGRDMFGCKVKK